MGISGIILTGENQSTWRKTCPSAVLSTINPTWTGLGSNTGLCGDRLVINHNFLVVQLEFSTSIKLYQWTRIVKYNINNLQSEDIFSFSGLRRNIYFRRPETGAMRDIFLAPFSPRLLASVVATGGVIATAMVLVNASTAKTNVREESNSNRKSSNTKWSLGEAMVGSVSVLCMQGSYNYLVMAH